MRAGPHFPHFWLQFTKLGLEQFWSEAIESSSSSQSLEIMAPFLRFMLGIWSSALRCPGTLGTLGTLGTWAGQWLANGWSQTWAENGDRIKLRLIPNTRISPSNPEESSLTKFFWPDWPQFFDRWAGRTKKPFRNSFRENQRFFGSFGSSKQHLARQIRENGLSAWSSIHKKTAIWMGFNTKMLWPPGWLGGYPISCRRPYGPIVGARFSCFFFTLKPTWMCVFFGIIGENHMNQIICQLYVGYATGRWMVYLCHSFAFLWVQEIGQPQMERFQVPGNNFKR